MKQIKKELQSFIELNDLMKSSAMMVGFDVDYETEKVLKSLDQRVRINIWQSFAIKTMNMLLEQPTKNSGGEE